MTAYEITLKDQARERIDGADAYAQEGQLTTFFRTASASPGRRLLERAPGELPHQRDHGRAPRRGPVVGATAGCDHLDAGSRPTSTTSHR